MIKPPREINGASPSNEPSTPSPAPTVSTFGSIKPPRDVSKPVQAPTQPSLQIPYAMPKVTEPKSVPAYQAKGYGILGNVGDPISEAFFNSKKVKQPVEPDPYKEAVDKGTEKLLDATLNKPKVKDVIKIAEKSTRGSSIFIAAPKAIWKASVDLLSNYISGQHGTTKDVVDYFDEEVKYNRDRSSSEDTTFVEKAARGLLDSGVQSLVGVAMNMIPVVGTATSAAYWTALSAADQIEEKGKVTSIANLGIDVAGDMVLGNMVEGILAKPAGSLAKAGFAKLADAGKGFLVEGLTEPAQTFLKYANDYRNAKTEDEKKAIIEETKNYVKKGGMALEFLVGGLAGGIIAGGASVLSGSNVSQGGSDYQTKAESYIKNVENNVNNVTGENTERPGIGVYGDVKELQQSPQLPAILEHIKQDAILSLEKGGVPVPAELTDMKVTMDNVRDITSIVTDAFNSHQPQTKDLNVNIPKPKLGITEDNDKDFTPEQQKFREAFRDEVHQDLKDSNGNKPAVARKISQETGIDNSITTIMVDELADSAKTPEGNAVYPSLDLTKIGMDSLSETAGANQELTQGITPQDLEKSIDDIFGGAKAQDTAIKEQKQQEEMKREDSLADNKEEIQPKKVKEAPQEKSETKDDISTPEGVAKQLIRSYVERGDSLKSLKDGQGGAYTGDYAASIGGFVNGKNMGPDKIIVTRAGGKDLKTPVVHSLTKIFNGIKAEKSVDNKVVNEEATVDNKEKSIAKPKKVNPYKKIADEAEEASKKGELQMKEGESNAWGNLTNPETSKAIASFKKSPTLANLQKVALTFDNFKDFRTTIVNAAGGKQLDHLITTDLKDIYNSAHGIDNETEDSTIDSNDTDRQREIPDPSDLPSGEDTGGGELAPSEVSGYDRATVLAESGDGHGANGATSIGKKGRQLINTQVEELLETRNYSKNPADYSEEDRELMANYTGAGGKESVGAEGAGLLNEYYTPPAVINKIWDIVKSIAPNAETAFEPSTGTGRFITLSPTEIKLDGAEISQVSGTIASILNPDSNINIGDFQELFFDKKTNKQKTFQQYDVVIGNPPFGDRAGFLKGKGEEPKINREEEYFIKRGLDMTKEGGHLVYVVNSSFLKKGSSEGKKRIAINGELVQAYRLPEDSFEDTSIGTDIVVFKKLDSNEPSVNTVSGRMETIIKDRYFSFLHPENVLGETKIRKNKFGQTESYVKGDLNEALSKISISAREEVKKAEKQKVIDKKEPLVQSNKQVKKTEPKISQTTKGEENVTDIVVPVQNISNKSDYSPVEINMLKKIERDLSIPNPTSSEMKYLNYDGGKYFNDGIYFSGDIYNKLAQLEKNKSKIVDEFGKSQYDKQKQGLESVLPKPIKIKDIAFDPLDRHVADVATTSISPYDNSERATTVLGAFTDYIRRNDVALSPRVSKWDVNRYVNGENASKDTKPIMGFIKNDAKRLFNHFLKNELPQNTVQQLEEKYNKEKNGYVQPDYTKIPIEVADMAKQFRGNDFRLSDTQKNGVGFLVNKGSGLIAYGVGVGKTHTLAIATVANMQKGWSKKPLFIVPKSTITKTWIATLHQMFPTLTINNLEGLQAPVVARIKKEKGEDKTKWINDGELSVISHEGILRLGFDEEQLRTATGDLHDALWIEPKSKRGAEKTKNVYDEIAGNAQKYVTDIMIKDLGFDHISVDEVHNFRKVFQGAKPEKVDDEGRGIGKKRYANVLGGTPSRRAQQLFLISQYIQKNNNNRNVFLASATPFENHATEVYNILSFVARDRMKSMGLININDFFSSFANFEVELDRKLDGDWINREKMKSFSNLPTLQGLLKEFIDYQEDPTLIRPDRKVLTPHLQMGELQTKNLAKIQNLLTGTKDMVEDEQAFDDESLQTFDVADDVEEGAFLKASTYSIANSVSPYFIKEFTKAPPSAKKLVEESPKIEYAIETLKKVKANEKTKDFGTFIFFGKMGVEYHPMIAEYIAKEVGYAPDEVAVLSGNVSDEDKETIKEKFNDGRVKVLLGGDQTKEGIDLQNNGFITMNLALGWNPTQISQVEGRVWRQGNRRSIAPLIYPLVENSGDSTIFNKFEEKGGRINDLFSYKGKMFDVGEIDPAEKKLALLTDPKDKAKMQIEIDKGQYYNERLLIENDKKELQKLQGDQKQSLQDSQYYEEELAKEGQTEEQIKYNKKELKKETDRQARITAKLESKGITDLNQAVNDLEIAALDMDNKIKAVDDTYEEKLALFSAQYKEDMKNRKTMTDHMSEIQGLIDEVKERSPEEVVALRDKKIEDVEAQRRLATPEFQTIEKNPEITLKTLDRIGDRKTVSKQFIADLARKSDIKQVEKNMIEEVLKTEPATVDVQAFSNKVLAEILPIKRLDFGDTTMNDQSLIGRGGKYESINLPDKLRGNVENYQEHIYETPVETGAGNAHFRGVTDNYFGHTRVEDMADNKTRRVIEVQSDLYQKGNLEREVPAGNNMEGLKHSGNKRYGELQKLQQYNDPTAHFRMIREEIKKASQDGKTKLQFPTGETAMKIEGLSSSEYWKAGPAGDGVARKKLKDAKMYVGMEAHVSNQDQTWVITEVSTDGKFKAIPKDLYTNINESTYNAPPKEERIKASSESFDISGNTDENNPIYKFYQKDLGKYLINKYGATVVTDPQGVTWFEVKTNKQIAESPIEAFQKATGTGEKLISFEEAKTKLEEYKKRLKLDFDVNFADAIFTGGANHERAYAVTYNNKISLTDNVRATTADHEMVHIVMNNIEKISAFDGITRDQLLKAANDGKDYGPDDIVRLNEKIAEGFQDMVGGAEQSRIPTVLIKFYQKLKILLTDLLRALGGDVDIVQDFYRKLYVAKGKEQVKLDSQNMLDRQVQFESEKGMVMAFNNARAEFLRKTRVDFEKIVEEAKNHSINLRRRDISFFDSLFAQSRDLYLKDQTEFKQADELMKIGDERRMKKSILDNKFATMLKPYFDMKVDDKAKINEVLMQGDQEATEYSDAQLAAKGLSTAQMEGYKSVRRSFNAAHELLLGEMEANGVPPEEIAQFKAERIGYMPHKWKYRFAIKKQNLKTGADPREENSWRTESMDVYKTAREADKVFADLNKNNENPEEVRYVNDTLDSLDVDFFSEQKFSFENMKSVIAKARVSGDVKGEMLIGLRNMIKEKGFGRNFIKRTGIEGYEKKELPAIIANYFAGMDGFITKMEAGKKYYGVLEKIDARRQKKFYAWVRDSIAYDMGNSKEGNALKQIAYIFHLANDLSFLLTNATQNFTVGLGELSKLVNGGEKIYKAETTLLKSMADWAVGNTTEEEKRVITELIKVGRLGGEMTAELMGFKNNPVYHSISKGINKALYDSTSFVEQNVNRVPAFLAARRLLKAQGLSDKEASEQALSVSDDINFRYGKQHRPVFMRGRKSVIFVFNHYMRSFLYQLGRDVKNKEFTSIIKKMFYTTVLAGTAGLPFAGLIKDIYNLIVGIDPDDEEKKTLGTMDLALERGLPASYLNIDLSDRLGIDILAISGAIEGTTAGTIDNLLQVKTYLGALGSLFIDRIPKGIGLLKQGRYLEAGGKLLPDMIGNPLKAYNGKEHGVMSQAGNPLIDEKGDRFKYTTYEAFVKGTGFTPTREQLAWDEQSRQWELKDAQSAGNAEVKNKINKMIRDGDTEGARAYQEEARKNGDLSSSTDYVRKAVKDEVLRDKVTEWGSGAQTRVRLDKMEKEIAKTMYGEKYTAQNLTSVTEEFAFRRVFGYDDKNAEELKSATSNKDKVNVLLKLREEMGPEAFREWFNKGRKTVQYESGRQGYVLISDNLKDLYTHAK